MSCPPSLLIEQSSSHFQSADTAPLSTCEASMTSPSTSHIAHNGRQTYRCVVIKAPTIILAVSGRQKASIKERRTLIPTPVLFIILQTHYSFGLFWNYAGELFIYLHKSTPWYQFGWYSEAQWLLCPPLSSKLNKTSKNKEFFCFF